MAGYFDLEFTIFKWQFLSKVTNIIFIYCGIINLLLLFLIMNILLWKRKKITLLLSIGVVILILYPFLGLPSYISGLRKHNFASRMHQADQDMQALVTAIEIYRSKTEEYPNGSCDINSPPTYIYQLQEVNVIRKDIVIEDVFNRPNLYRYYVSDDGKNFVIFSVGPDRSDNGAKDYTSAIAPSVFYDEKTKKGNIISSWSTHVNRRGDKVE